MAPKNYDHLVGKTATYRPHFVNDAKQGVIAKITPVVATMEGGAEVCLSSCYFSEPIVAISDNFQVISTSDHQQTELTESLRLNRTNILQWLIDGSLRWIGKSNHHPTQEAA